MRRALLAIAVAAGLAIGTVVPVSALGETSITLNCNDGTSVPLLVDTDTLNSLTASVQAMTLYPAGLSCSIIQNPLGSFFGHVALAAPGQNPFIVGGGRWQWPFPCAEFPHPLDLGEVAKVPGAWSYEPLIWSPTHAGPPTVLVWVNIAVNVHMTDPAVPTSTFGTLNETIPTQEVTCPAPQGTFTLSESHFTSKPTPGCLQTSAGLNPPRSAVVTSRITQTSGATSPSPGALGGLTGDIHFSFVDGGNPSEGTDLLQGPPAPDDSNCPAFGSTPTFILVNGNISIRNPASP